MQKNKLSNQNRIMRIDWLETLKAIKVGKSETFTRQEITVSNLRTKASKLKKKGYVFVVQSVDNDDKATVTRER